MVERRSVRFTSDGRFEEYDKAGVMMIRNGKPPEKMIFDNLTEEITIASIQTDLPQEQIERSYSVPIEARSAEIVQPVEQNQIRVHKETQMEWSSFLIIFFVLIVALYTLRIILKRLLHLRREYKKNEMFGSTNKSSLLADMDDEWRMQKIDSQNTQRRQAGHFDEDLNKQFEQRWPAYQGGQLNQETSAKFIRVSPQKQTPRYEDDEFKRS